MRTTITPDLFIEQIVLGVEVQPLDSAFEIFIQAGRQRYRFQLDDLSRPQQRELERLYRAGRLRFGHPGDFIRAPYFFRMPLRTRRTNFVACRRL